VVIIAAMNLSTPSFNLIPEIYYIQENLIIYVG